jgi:hypothetical protein
MKRNAVDNRIAKRHSDIPQDGMFDVAPEQHGGRQRTARIKNIARDTCPTCGQDEVGQVRDGSGLAWREHYRATIGGARVRCSGSGTEVRS